MGVLVHASAAATDRGRDRAWGGGRAPVVRTHPPGRFTTEEEIDYCVERCVKHVERLRNMSPLWEMVQEGIDIKTIEWAQH